MEDRLWSRIWLAVLVLRSCLIVCRASFAFQLPSRRVRRHQSVIVRWNQQQHITATEESRELDPPPDPTASPQDDFFRSVRTRLPKKLQYFLRDSGILRAAIDAGTLLAVRPILKSHPSALEDFFWLSGIHPNRPGDHDSDCKNDFKRFAYGSQARQVLDLMRPTQKNSQRLIVFVHGGAWGSGFPSMYRLAAKSFLEQGSSVAVIGYRTYPSANVDGQIQDIAKALDFLKCLHPEPFSTVLVGHSSGAHLGMLGILRDELEVDRFIGLAGVYDIPSHYLFERGRGVDRISPLAPACGGSLHKWKVCSPLRYATVFDKILPPILLLHGEKDTTVPYTSSTKLVLALSQSPTCTAVSLDILPDVGHAETVLHLMFGGSTLDKILEWLIAKDRDGDDDGGGRI